MRVTYGLRRAATMWRDEVALMDASGHRTWSEFLDRVQRSAGALKSLGLSGGDTVAVLMLNNTAYAELNYSVAWAGGVLVPVNTRLAAPEIVFQMNDAACKAIVIDDTFLPMLDEIKAGSPALQHVIYAGSATPPEGAHEYEALLSSAEPVPDADRSYDDLMSIYYTGGTTGRSKGVMLSHTNVVSNALNGLHAIGYTPSSTYLHVAPMFHLADAGTTFSITLGGGKHAFIPGFEPEATLKAIQDFKVTHVILVPTMINMVINHPAVTQYDLSSLEKIVYGASPIPGAVLQKALDVLPCDLVQGYGMTESAQLVTMLPAADHRHPTGSKEAARLKSCGQAVVNVEVQVVDENDQPAPTGEVGEVCFRGPNVMQGYLNMPEETAEALKGGWMHSGDVGYLDEYGYLYLVDRAKDMIISGGENIYSTEVETAIYSHPAVMEAAVIGIPHAEWGEAVHAVVVLKPGMDVNADELIAHCKSQIAGYKTPKSITFESEALPKSGAGKILKRDLRKPYWEDEDRMVH
jgi:long-chain acyl-CoA synthetase